MKKIIASCITLFCSVFVQANDEVFNLTFDNHFNLPQVALTIAGEDRVFTLDTGSKRGLHLPMELINKLPNKTELAHKMQSQDLSGNITESRAFIVSALTLGSFDFHNVDILEYKEWGYVLSNSDAPSQPPQEPQFPVIGLGLFADNTLTLNFPENKIIISDDAPFSPPHDENWTPLPFILGDEGIVISMTDHIKDYQMILDSAATLSLIKEQSLSPKTVKLNHNDDYHSVAVTVKNNSTSNVNAIVLDNLPDEFHSDGLLGVDFLSKNVLIIDFKQQKLWIKAQ